MAQDISRETFNYHAQIETRWHDNDVYGHINNVIYYSFFDSAVNKFLIEEAGLDIHNGSTIAYVVSSNCNYLASLSYPEAVSVGVGVRKLGNSSVTYVLGIFSAHQPDLKAHGEFVHVFVDRNSNKPTAIPENIRVQLEKLVI